MFFFRNEGVINIIITIPEPVFIKSIDTEDHRHTVEHMCEIMEEIIEKYGALKFFTVTTDNAKNMRKACKLLEQKYPHLSSYGCLAHTLNLMIGDIRKLVSVKKYIDDVNEIIKTIRGHTVLLSMFTKIGKENNIITTLKLPVITRWGSVVLSLKSMLQCKTILRILAVSEDVGQLPEPMKRKLRDDIFWVKILKLTNLLEPILQWITRLESNKPTIHFVTQAFSEISKSFNDNLPEAPISKIDQERIIEIFEHRRKFALKPIHLAADILNCSSIGSNITDQEQVEAMQFICEVAEDLNYSQVKISAILINLAKYRAKEGLWKNSFIWISAKDIEPALWWKGICGSSCLSSIAHRILSNPATSAATERSFSTEGFIHSKHRNRLLNSRIEKLSFVKQNLKISSDVKVNTKNVNNLSVNVDTLNQTNYETEIIEVNY